MIPAATNRPTAVRLEAVTKTYVVGEPVHALDALTLEIPEGSFTAVMGPSGSGKSTLMNLIGLLDAPTSGRLTIAGQDATTLSDRERTRLRGDAIGFVFQSFNLMPKLTALDNVMLPMAFRGDAAAVRRDRARGLLARVGLADRERFKPNQLSGGQRQRIAIARALANEPALLLADEPTGNLDSATGEEVLALFDELHASGYTILLVTHEREVAERAERIVHVRDGRVASIEDLPARAADGAVPATPAGHGARPSRLGEVRT